MSDRKIYSLAGFTLLELMVVLSLMGVVSAIGLNGFFRMTDYWNVLQENMRLNKTASNAFDSMTDDFWNMLSARASGTPLQGNYADTEDNVRFWRISFEDDAVTFPVEVFNPLIQSREQLLVTYAIDREHDEPRLVRKTVRLGNPDVEPAITATFDDVAGMRIRYFDGESWLPEWKTSTSPKLVRVSLSLVDGDRADGQLARVMVFPVPVQ